MILGNRFPGGTVLQFNGLLMLPAQPALAQTEKRV
jgi:hypothetical protein